MRRFLIGTLTGTLAWMVALGGAPAATAETAATATAAIRPGVGVQFHATWGDYSNATRLEALDKMAAAGLEYVRVDIGWAAFQEQCRTCWSQWQIDLVDFVVAEANKRGIEVIGTLWRTPDWANGGRGVIAPPSDPADYGNYAGWMAERYKGKVAAWEIWNEPNLDGFWSGTVAEYVKLLKAAYPKIKAADPGAVVLAGSVAHNDDAYLRQMYEAGAQGSFDAISTHPYQGQSNLPPEEPDTGGDKHWLLSHVAQVKKLMNEYGDGTKKIWFTEMGWSSHSNTGGEAPWKLGVTPQTQGEYFVRAIEFVKSSYPYVKAMVWYNERNKNTGDTHEDNFGLMKRDLTPKQSYFALKDYLGGSAPPPDPEPSPSPSPEPSPEPSPSPSPEPSPEPAPAPEPDPEPNAPSDTVCTITGTDGPDVLRGARGPDVICGLGGDDVLRGLGGDDIIYGGAGDDFLDGGKGQNILIGGSGRDVIKSRNGGDKAFGGGGRDRLLSRNGRRGDLADGGAGKDVCKGDLGDDFVACFRVRAN